MTVSIAAMEAWCKTLLGGNRAHSHRPLTEFLAAIPRLESLSDVPSGTPVLVRGDLDCKLDGKVDDDIRLRSMQETLDFGRRRGWKQILFGHVGREPKLSLDEVGKRLGEILKLQTPVAFIKDWLDVEKNSIREDVARLIRAAAPGDILLLENTRKYQIEVSLWDAPVADAGKHAPKLASLANEFAEKLATVYVNEAFSAGSLDCSSTIVPAAMQRVALGTYVAGEFEGPVLQCLPASLVVFSGLKADKLYDLEGVVKRNKVRFVIVAGNLAMALKKAEAELAGGDFCMGAAENPANEKEPFFVERKFVDLAKEILRVGKQNGMRFVLPVDFVLKDGRVVSSLGANDQQFDVGTQSSQRFTQAIDDYLAELQRDPTLPKVAFYNGVFGKFEKTEYQAGTRNFIALFKRMKDTNVDVYVGGGEGGKAVKDFGGLEWIKHCFTAGGTVLNALGSEPVPYLLALKTAAERKGQA